MLVAIQPCDQVIERSVTKADVLHFTEDEEDGHLLAEKYGLSEYHRTLPKREISISSDGITIKDGTVSILLKADPFAENASIFITFS